VRCPLKQKVNELLRDLGEALVDAIADSLEVNENLLRVQQAGYSLYLTVECRHEEQDVDERRRIPLKSHRDRLSGRGRLPEPVFKINTSDLRFLRSIGIDPTRKWRKRGAKRS